MSLFQGNGAPPCTVSILQSRHTPAQRSSFPLECDFYMRAHAGCFPLQGIVFLAAAIPCLTGLCSFNGSGVIRSLNSLLYPFCQNEETDAHSEFCLWRGLRRGLGFRNGSELLCPWASLVLHRSPPEGCMGALLDAEIAGAQNIYVIVLAVPAKGQLCCENLQPF